MSRSKKIRRLLALLLKPHRVAVCFSIALIMTAALLSTFNPFIIRMAINQLSTDVTLGQTINLAYIGKIVILLSVVGISNFVSEYGANFIMTGAVQNGIRGLRLRINDKMNALPVSYFDSHQQGTVLSCLTNDVDAVSNALQQTFLKLFHVVVTITCMYFFMMFLSFGLGLICLIIIPLTLLISRLIYQKSQKNFRVMQDALADMNGYVQESYGGFSVIKLYNREKESINQFKEINQRINYFGFRGNFVSSLFSPLLELVVDMTYIVMVFLTGYAVLFSGMLLADMQAFVQYIWQIYSPLGQISQLSSAIQSAIASMERISDFLEEEEEAGETSKTTLLSPETVRGHVVFRHVRFSYVPEAPLIDDVSFEAKPGETIAIVGPTGAGKTTLINLLMRFYEIDGGSITIDGVNTKDIKREEVRSLFGMVLQDAWLYHATISENIRFGRLSASEYEVVDAAKSANVNHFIRTMPGGYDMVINEEANNVSLGQKQLLTIARVILADPKILILDEATSSVDTRMERLIQESMKKLMEGRTSFVIAHRLSTIRDADLILVMDHGNIVEQGRHDSLLKKGGLYAQLYNSQFAEE